MNVAIAVPFFNEASRFDAVGVQELCRSGLHIILVDDGSTDGTADLLTAVAALNSKVSILTLERNRGKAEAVRRGLLTAIAEGANIVGYADGDLATPVHEILRLAGISERDAGLSGVLGSRIRLAGRSVVRDATRHYLGRLVATYIDARTTLRVYDTQCGAKLFRVTPELSAALATDFLTRWLFDIELLHRLRLRHEISGRALRLREEPLETWEDVAGSRIRGLELLRVLMDFLRLEQALRRQKTRS